MANSRHLVAVLSLIITILLTSCTLAEPQIEGLTLAPKSGSYGEQMDEICATCKEQMGSPVLVLLLEKSRGSFRSVHSYLCLPYSEQSVEKARSRGLLKGDSFLILE